MSDELRVRYLFVNMKLANYVALSVVSVLITSIAAAVAYALLRDHPQPLISYVWLVLAIAVPLQVVEAAMAIRRSRRRADGEDRT